jgi:phenylpropionate dioxygenase-like ring-hydroxylating dioxygenase large terminal subunit
MQLTEAWYVVALASGFGPKHCMKAKLHWQEFVIWRQEDGAVAAAHARCPHKGAPLHLGCVSDGAIQCGYHGWRFNASGDCIEIPSASPDSAIPGRAKIETVPCQEAYGFIWLWWGDGEPSPLPAVVKPGADLRCIEGSQEWSAHWLRAVEGFLDIGHVPFIHKNTFGQATPSDLVYAEERQEPDYLYGLVEGNPLQPLLGSLAPKSLSGNGKQHFHYWCANLVLVVAEVGDFWIYTYLAPVPTQENQALVIWRQLRSFLKSDSIDAKMRDKFGAFLSEDKAIIESQTPAQLDLNNNDSVFAANDSMAIALRKLLMAKFEARQIQ